MLKSSTFRKLEEAAFFLKQLKRNYTKHPQFDYFLSAYVTSARSVLWVMRKEYGSVNGWEIWYQNIVPSKEELDFIGKINEIRVRTEKKEPLHTDSFMKILVPKERYSEEIGDFFRGATGKKVILNIDSLADTQEIGSIEINEKQLKVSGFCSDVFRTIDEFPENDVRLICDTYYKWLKKIVDACDSKFQSELDINNGTKLEIEILPED